MQQQRQSVLAQAADSSFTDKASTTQTAAVSVGFKNLLLAILDANPYLGDGSKQAIATAARMALENGGALTLLVIDEPGTTGRDPKTRLDTLSWHMREQGVTEYKVLEQKVTAPASVLVGDVADEIKADLLLLSAEAVHSKFVDANQLAEFVSCPILLIP
ncbi:MAG: hypothetical protein WDW36_009673 [Sanguina aurantia]